MVVKNGDDSHGIKRNTVCYSFLESILPNLLKRNTHLRGTKKTVTFKKAAVLKVFGDENKKTLLRDPYT